MDMPGLTISEAARTWAVHRDTVKRWVRTGVVEASKDNQGMWRIAEGQQPPPSAAMWHPREDGLGAAAGRTQGDPGKGIPGAVMVQPPGDPGATLGEHLAELRDALAETGLRLSHAERDLAVSRREVELLRERTGELVEERDRLRGELVEHRELLRRALDRPSLLERLLRALRGSPGPDKALAGVGRRREQNGAPGGS